MALGKSTKIHRNLQAHKRLKEKIVKSHPKIKKLPVSISGKKITIDKLLNIFSNIYGHYDRERTVEQLWLQVTEAASSIAEAVREFEYANLTSHISNLFCWLCGFIVCIRNNKNPRFRMKEDFSSIIWQKYPNRCPLCRNNPCQCLLKREEIQKRTSQEKNDSYEGISKEAKETIDNRIRDLDKLCKMFERIYHPSIYVMSLEEITFHFTEEVGEVAKNIRELVSISGRRGDSQINLKEIKRNFRKEIADVFNWLCAIIIKLNYLIKNSLKVLKEFEFLSSANLEITFSDIINKYYFIDGKYKCRTCKLEKCDILKHPRIYPILVTKNFQK